MHDFGIRIEQARESEARRSTWGRSGQAEPGLAINSGRRPEAWLGAAGEQDGVWGDALESPAMWSC